MRKLAMAGIGAVVAVFVATLLARRATRHGLRAAAAQPRAARLEDLIRDTMAPVRFAMANSLWGETSIAPCLVGAVWGDRPAAFAQAAFAPQMRLSMRAPLKAPATPARGAVWTLRERPEIAPANDADVAARYVAMEPGTAPVVRVLKIADFRPKAPRPARTYATLRHAA